MPPEAKGLEKRARSDDLINAAQEVGWSQKYRGMEQEREYFDGKFFTRNIFLHYFSFLC